MRLVRALLIVFLGCGFAARSASQAPPVPAFTLTIVVEGMSSDEGNLGVLVFNNAKGWPEDRTVALRDIAVSAQKGTQTLKVPDLPLVGTRWL